MNSTLQISPLEGIEKHLTSPQMVAKFMAAVDRAAMPYIQSVLIAVEQNEGLQKCTPESIGVAALRAASLQLFCDPAVRQAHLVPYKRNKKRPDGTWYSYYEAVFQPHYMGLYTLAMRTRKYRIINVAPVPKGWTVTCDFMTGLHSVSMESGLKAHIGYLPTKKDEAAAQGWIGYLRTKDGYEKSVYWTVQEIHAHAAKYSKSYNSDKSPWRDPNFRPTMEKKTVLIDLLKWADMSGIGDAAISEALKADEFIDAQAEDVPSEPLPSGVDEGVDEAFHNGSKRLMDLREKAKKDPSTAFWEAVNSAGLDHAAGEDIKQDCGNDMAAAFEKVATAYAKVI